MRLFARNNLTLIVLLTAASFLLASFPHVHAVRVSDHAICSSVDLDAKPPSCKQRTSEFLPTDKEAWVWIKVSMDASDLGDKIELKFYDPDGQVFATGPAQIYCPVIPFMTISCADPTHVSDVGEIVVGMAIGINSTTKDGDSITSGFGIAKSYGLYLWWSSVQKGFGSARERPGEWRAELALDGRTVVVERFKIHGTDTDGDGLLDPDEVRKYKTDPLMADTDADGLSDGDEIKTHRTNPRLGDTDGDSLSDGEEVRKHESNPLEKDTDRDGLDDASEVAKGTNLRVSDSDGDGLNDGDEVGRYMTDPLKVDTDRDGLSDRDEARRGTSPLKVDTDGDSWNDSIDMQPLNALIPNVIIIIAVVAIAAIILLMLRMKRKTSVPAAAEAASPSAVPAAYSPARLGA